MKTKKERVKVNLRSIFAERYGFRADHALFFQSALPKSSLHGFKNEHGDNSGEKRNIEAFVEREREGLLTRYAVDTELRALGT